MANESLEATAADPSIFHAAEAFAGRRIRRGAFPGGCASVPR